MPPEFQEYLRHMMQSKEHPYEQVIDDLRPKMESTAKYLEAAAEILFKAEDTSDLESSRDLIIKAVAKLQTAIGTINERINKDIS